MIRRPILAFTKRGMAMMASKTPMEDAIRSKLNQSLFPTHLEIHNDSHLHTHHAAMAGNTSRETHFRVVVTSEAFEGKMQPARHRMVYGLLKEEMGQEGGIHALQLRTRTAGEWEKEQKQESENGTTDEDAQTRT